MATIDLNIEQIIVLAETDSLTLKQTEELLEKFEKKDFIANIMKEIKENKGEEVTTPTEAEENPLP